MDVHLSIGDARTFAVPAAGLILIIDVLQYLDPADQASLLRRCASALVPGGRLIFRLPDTRRGPLAWATRLLDRLLLGMGGWSTRPAYQSPEAYVGLLAEAGMSVDVRRYRNWLPLAHVVFFARKRAVEE
jgi:trans-aconitate methyltransferase